VRLLHERPSRSTRPPIRLIVQLLLLAHAEGVDPAILGADVRQPRAELRRREVAA